MQESKANATTCGDEKADFHVVSLVISNGEETVARPNRRSLRPERRILLVDDRDLNSKCGLCSYDFLLSHGDS
jgi:hypothetical protein